MENISSKLHSQGIISDESFQNLIHKGFGQNHPKGNCFLLDESHKPKFRNRKNL